jgi:5-methylcytosine-specific restriction endonuclease McrA
MAKVKNEFMAGLKFGKIRGGGIGTKRKDKSRQYADGRIVLSAAHYRELRLFVYDAHFEVFGEVRCHLCDRLLLLIGEMELDHLTPRGNGGCYRDDRFVKPACHECNSKKGSKRVPTVPNF